MNILRLIIDWLSLLTIIYIFCYIVWNGITVHMGVFTTYISPLKRFFIKEIKEVKKYDYDKLIDCAAIRAPDGRVWTGKRHNHCIKTIIQATGVKRIGGDYEQGFVTMSNRFVNREEAYNITKESKQVTKFHVKGELFSEDLY